MRLPAGTSLSPAVSLSLFTLTQPMIVNDRRFCKCSIPAPPPRSTACVPGISPQSSALGPPLGGTVPVHEGFPFVSDAVAKTPQDVPEFAVFSPAFSLKRSSTRRGGGRTGLNPSGDF